MARPVTATPARGLRVDFEIAVIIARRYIQEAVALPGSVANNLNAAVPRILLLAYVILTGTLFPIDQVAESFAKQKAMA
ncbi:hypothetical protein MRQ36_02380 [Micromonospora sp. R77]|uniref:hypothetical protein n=1 Tax=Micromonospora sp. R77 TaxID=2925836 RepID=UPI001F60008A|nr:hypothetical protein [Micromonospora sp. R77]MCI4061483.1 hypothetical protein [Micromonospora sp. R77]